MRKIYKTIIIILIMLFIPLTSFAGDMLYHFMQAHQDYVVIGKILDKNNKNLCKVEVSELITESSIRNDIPKIIEVEIEYDDYQKGDNIAVSLSKRGGGYRIENGICKISTNNSDSLEVINITSGREDENAALELFLKSRGKIKDFYFSDSKTYVHTDSGIVANEDLCIYSPETGKTLPTEYEKNAKYVVENENNNIAVYLVIIVLLVIVVIVYMNKKGMLNIKENTKIENKVEENTKQE